MSLLTFPLSVSATEEFIHTDSLKFYEELGDQSTNKGGTREMLTQPAPAMKANYKSVCCLVAVLMEDLEWARALLKRA